MREFTDKEWAAVRSIFEKRGVSREVAEERPYVPFRRGAGWVTADSGPFAIIPKEQRDATILRDVRGADGLVMHKHPVPLSDRKLAEFPPQLRPTPDPVTGSIVNHDHQDPWMHGKRKYLTVRLRDHIENHHPGGDVEGLHDNYLPELHRHRDLIPRARAAHVMGHWHHGVKMPLDKLHVADEAGKYKLPSSPLVPDPWDHEHPVPLPRGGCHHKPKCATTEEHTAAHLERYKHVSGQESGFHLHSKNRPNPNVTYGKRLDVHPLGVPLLRDAEVVLVSMEGNLKGDSILTCILKHKLPWAVVDIPSVGQWRVKELDDFAREYLADRQVFLVCDSDWAHPSKFDVQRQAFAFREYLRRLLQTKYGVQVAAAPSPEGAWDDDCPASHLPNPDTGKMERCPVKVGCDDWLAGKEFGGYGGRIEDLIVVEREASKKMLHWAEQHEAKTKRDRPEGDQRNSKSEARLMRLLPLITPANGKSGSSVASLSAFTSMKRATVADALPTLRWQALGEDGPLLSLERTTYGPGKPYRPRYRVTFDVDVRTDEPWQLEWESPEETSETWTWELHSDYRFRERSPRRALGRLLAR